MVSMSKNAPDETSQLGESSETVANHIASDSVKINTGVKNQFENDLISPGMAESDTVDNGSVDDQSETSPSLKEGKEIIESVKSSIGIGISLNETFNCKYKDAIKAVIKDCKIDCSMTEEQVENLKRRKMLSLSDTGNTIIEVDDNDSESSDTIPHSYRGENEGLHGAKNEEIGKDGEGFKNSIEMTCENINDNYETNKLFSSTPLNKIGALEKIIYKGDFEGMSPLEQPMSKTRNLKRKNLRLDSIKEDDENSFDSCSEKKIKIDSDEKEVVSSASNTEEDISSVSHYEAPAKSILKKWQPSYVPRNFATSRDETSGHEEDDFEIACKSLNEELMKSTTNIDTLEKESQIEDDKFEEIWRELNQELDGKTSLSLKTMEESMLSESNITVLSVKPMDVSDLSQIDSTNDETIKNDKSSSSGLNSTIVDKGLEVASVKELSVDGKVLQPRENTISEKVDKERNISLTAKLKQSSGSDSSEFNENTAPEKNASKSSSRFPDKKDADPDEEDILLEEDKNSKDRAYNFVEYVSEDPQENEDNYNPEWQKLGQLTSDEERYKAVRDRWRSLIPPDPNKDLTVRQWREKNKLPPIKMTKMNNNDHLFEDTERTEKCTAVFEMKIESIMEELEKTRKDILDQRNFEFEQLAQQQDAEQRRFLMSGASTLQYSLMHRQQLEQCRILKNMHDDHIKDITYRAEQKIKLLREASEEVLLFQKFYKGVGNDDHDDDILYMTSTQVKELVETEEMLEQYENFYRG